MLNKGQKTTAGGGAYSAQPCILGLKVTITPIQSSRNNMNNDINSNSMVILHSHKNHHS